MMANEQDSRVAVVHKCFPVRVIYNYSNFRCVYIYMYIPIVNTYAVVKYYLILLNQLDGNLASDISTRCSSRPHGNEN